MRGVSERMGGSGAGNVVQTHERGKKGDTKETYAKVPLVKRAYISYPNMVC